MKVSRFLANLVITVFVSITFSSYLDGNLASADEMLRIAQVDIRGWLKNLVGGTSGARDESVKLKSFPELSQRDPRIYRSPDFMRLKDTISGDALGADKPHGEEEVQNLACLATVYVMIARGGGKTTATVEDFYSDPRAYGGNGPGALKPEYVSADVPLEQDKIMQSLRAGTPVILHGEGGPLGHHFVLLVGFNRNADSRLSFQANDPWPDAARPDQGREIIIERQSAPLLHPIIRNLAFRSMRYVAVESAPAIEPTKASASRDTTVPEFACTVFDPNLKGKYSGECKNGVAEGKGRAVGKDTYEGQFVGGLAEGYGVYELATETYEGDFYRGLRQGQGKFALKNGALSCEGQFKNNKVHGKAKCVYQNGIYEGDWVDGARTGKGIIRTSSGVVYDGDLVNGKRDGYGTQLDSNGDSYTGQWRDDKFHGQGTRVLNGKTETGQFENSRFVDAVQPQQRVQQTAQTTQSRNTPSADPCAQYDPPRGWNDYSKLNDCRSNQMAWRINAANECEQEGYDFNRNEIEQCKKIYQSCWQRGDLRPSEKRKCITDAVRTGTR